MAHTHSLNLRLPLLLPKSKPSLPLSLHLFQATPSLKSSIQPLLSTSRVPHRRLCAQEKSSDSSTPTSDETLVGDQPQAQAQSQSEEKEADSLTEVASELKQMLREKKEREEQGDSLLIGVAQEIKGIEWPDLGKVVGTTGVVLAVIAGSTAALLSVNGILAELSDKVFAGKGIQDFF
ncbi:Preprotein translocase subunit SECE1 [Rhynchospora pubera]|uniref:Preprotein translocase subunit SECE1 n=1 Tax=Rhynchospora pubera TaxID=906938 RepID=A0AAV8HP42_9POAL|nr:Preprotein translocase subunit SECE1 [Rhynchospora pubera]KAJ4793990.1 Preprotein translocase subunit SECE1 [Rhynchospora pubera]KAJ4817827.1 Preprotein translocase subunit SECE1 [Rhynchospora pubera]